MTDTLSSSIFESSQEELITDMFQGEEETAPEKPFVDQKKPERHAARSSGEMVIGGVISLVGNQLVKQQIDVPVGRVISFQSPISGKIIDEFIAHTWIDKLLQPLFRKADDIEDIGMVIGLPLMVGLLERKPEMMPMVWPAMEEMMDITLDQMAKSMRAKKAKRRRQAKTADIEEMLGVTIEPGMNVSDALLKGFFMSDEEAAQQNAGEI